MKRGYGVCSTWKERISPRMRAGRYPVYNAPYGRSIRPAARPHVSFVRGALKAVSLYVDSRVLLKRYIDAPDSSGESPSCGDARF